jgi:hypothetical protein
LSEATKGYSAINTGHHALLVDIYIAVDLYTINDSVFSVAGRHVYLLERD